MSRIWLGFKILIWCFVAGETAGELTVVRENIVCMMSRDVNTVITRGKAGAGPGMGDLWPCRSWSGIRRAERWGMMLNNPFIMQHPPGSDNKRTQFGAWRAPLLPPLSPGWKSFFIWKTNIYFRNARSELTSENVAEIRDWKQRDKAATINLNPGPGLGFMIVSTFNL